MQSVRDGKFTSVGDMLRKMSIPDRPKEFVTRRVVERVALGGATKYSYCPYCVRRAEAAGKDYKAELRPLWRVTYKVLYSINGVDGMYGFERVDECPVCRDRDGEPLSIGAEDWERSYTKKWSEPRPSVVRLDDTKALRAAGFVEYAESLEGRELFAR